MSAEMLYTSKEIETDRESYWSWELYLLRKEESFFQPTKAVIFDLSITQSITMEKIQDLLKNYPSQLFLWNQAWS